MQETLHRFSWAVFFRRFLASSLWLFVVPVSGLLVFLHVESDFDERVRKGLIEQIRADPNLSPAEKAESVEALREFALSEMLMNADFAEHADPGLRRNYTIFRWMIRIAIICLVSGAGVILAGGACVLLSLGSQRAQYLSLSAGWHVLRLISVVQIVGQGILIVALSYWVTVLLTNTYYPQLIICAAIFVISAVVLMLKGIFQRVKLDFPMSGRLIEKGGAAVLWEDLESICQELDTRPPDQLIAGIDDCFFVTEHPVTLDGQLYTGRTLFISLPLLRHLDGSEADSIMAHEMAHFSGDDTMYSCRISPLLVRYENYLAALNAGFTWPAFHLMLFFRLGFEISLSRLSRERELRADRIASGVTSPRDMIAGLIKTIAFSQFRSSIEQRLFEHEERLESTDIHRRVEEGFREFSESLVTEEFEIDWQATVHPFDRHPSLRERAAALGVELTPELTARYLSSDSDGLWHHNITGATGIEIDQWTAYEQQFRSAHEQSLAFRYMPSTDRERELVNRFFPPVTIAGRHGVFEIDCEQIRNWDWGAPVLWSEVTKVWTNPSRLEIETVSQGQLTVNLKHYRKKVPQLMELFQMYHGRYATAAARQADEPDEVSGSPA